eukprot:TRINITY_DN4458_c0_g2_i1.p1 TRINITY_DN4458_c0_g2~~TRINITY_DN4458_c0_g2_i1.p1  ORF type:complete len:577 (-),score=117.25 TRINITY_DN4458_c0_g2_i1:44-1705(-)
MFAKPLRKFFLKVHPDFFTSAPSQMQQNARSLQNLLAVLDWHKQFQGGRHVPPPQSSYNFVFHCRQAQDKTTLLSSKLEFPSDMKFTKKTAGTVQLALEDVLGDLLRQAEVPTDALTTPLTGGPKERKRLASEFAESISEHWAEARVPTLDELMAADLVRVSRDLTPRETAIALVKVKQLLEAKRLKYELWYAVPLVLVPSEAGFSASDCPGFLLAPWDFSPEAFVEFVTVHQDTLRQHRDELLERAERIESALEGLQAALGLAELSTPDLLPLPVGASASGSEPPRQVTGALPKASGNGDTRQVQVADRSPGTDIALTVPTAEIETAVAVLHGMVEELRAANLEGVGVELSDTWGIRHNGRISVNARRLASGEPNATSELREFLGHVRPRLPELRQRFSDAKKAERLMQVYSRRIEHVLRCHVDVTMDAPYVHKLEFLKELWESAYHLVPYGLEGFTFCLGSVAAFDWDLGFVMLPHDFDCNKLIEAVWERHGVTVDDEHDVKAHGSSTASRFQPSKPPPLLHSLNGNRNVSRERKHQARKQSTGGRRRSKS